METGKSVYYTAAELAARGSGDIPPELVSTTHLIYSSPATLAFNSPGAEGYGVKRAGLAVPGSVMLIVSPGCCGRNTSAISRMPGYEDRFFYLTMDETDLVTGRHLKKVPKAVEELCASLEKQGKRPRAVMICITCVDALLGTDMERICRRAQERVPGVRVQPCYMYALTREGRKPPMVHVRQSIYQLLEPRKKKSTSVNILGFFAPLEGGLAASDGKSGSEIFPLLRQAGVRRIRQIGTCPDYDAFQEMAEANFNIVLNPEARPAAYDLQERLGIPFIEMSRFYQIDRIEAQYAALGKVLQTSFDDSLWKSEAVEAVEAFRSRFPDAVFSIGEAMNGNPFELACALVREGFAVREIFGTISKDSFIWLGILAKLSPETRIYSNLHPSMLHYGRQEAEKTGVTVTIGRDAGWYHPEVPNVAWITDVQPFGYTAVTGLFRALSDAMETGSRGSFSSAVSLGGGQDSDKCSLTDTLKGGESLLQMPAPEDFAAAMSGETDPPSGYRRFTTPFAPDQSGAVSVLYDMNGICVICDAGGCTGNICGFDEPRWFGNQSAVFSAGLRDMDAILGRDDKLVEKLADTAKQIPAAFASIVGTPVPAVIGTDYRALCRMASRKTGLPVIGVNTDGMEYYDRGIEKTYLALLDAFSKGVSPQGVDQADKVPEKERIIGIWGYSPLDFAGILSEEDLRAWAEEQGYTKMICCGAGTGVDDLQKIGRAEKNIVLSPAGTAAAKWLQKEYGTPWSYFIPDAEKIFDRFCSADMAESQKSPVYAQIRDKKACMVKEDDAGRPATVLVLHQQVLADTICRLLRSRGIEADTAGFFMMNKDLLRDTDSFLREETDLRKLVLQKGYDTVIADRSLMPLLEGLPVRLLHLPHFAVSGEQSLP